MTIDDRLALNIGRLILAIEQKGAQIDALTEENNSLKMQLADAKAANAKLEP